jgi:hypothetical protein
LHTIAAVMGGAKRRSGHFGNIAAASTATVVRFAIE